MQTPRKPRMEGSRKEKDSAAESKENDGAWGWFWKLGGLYKKIIIWNVLVQEKYDGLVWGIVGWNDFLWGFFVVTLTYF